MNELTLVIARDEFGVGPCDGLEPVIDGVSLIDVLKRADGEISHGGLTEIDRALASLRSFPREERRTAQVLGCLCGTDDCSYVTVTMSVTSEAVTWSKIRTSMRPIGPPGPTTYEGVGPFIFARDQYVTAVSHPVRAERPVREPVDGAALEAGIPTEPAEWLRAMNMAFGPDFLTRDDPAREVAARGLRALADAGNRLEEDVVRRWAQERRCTDDAIEQYVAGFNELNPPPGRG